MNTQTGRLLLWTPRALGILFAAFISLFALDVFGEGHTFWATAVALLIHLVPTALIVGALVIAWRHAWVGGVLFIGLGAWLLGFVRGPWWVHVAMSAPMFLAGVLFFASWRYGARSGAAG